MPSTLSEDTLPRTFKTEEEVANSATIPGTDTAPGDIKYRDINNDGKIDGEDRVYIGNTMPKWTFGLNLFAEWKGLDATFLFQEQLMCKAILQVRV